MQDKPSLHDAHSGFLFFYKGETFAADTLQHSKKRFLHLSVKIKQTSQQEPSKRSQETFQKKNQQNPMLQMFEDKSLILPNLVDEQSLAPRAYKVG